MVLKRKKVILFFRQIPKIDRVLWLLALISALTIFGIFYLNRVNNYRWEKTGEELRQLEHEQEKIRQEIQDKLDADRKAEEAERNKIKDYCSWTRNPRVCESIFKSGLKIEENTGFKGIAKWFVAVARKEQNYNCPNFNCWGWGSPNPGTWARFKSHEDAMRTITASLLARGYRQMDDKTIMHIATWYAADYEWGHRVLSIFDSI